MDSKEVKKQYRKQKEQIRERVKEFKGLEDADEERIFQELVFVILTSQTEAEKAWNATQKLREKGLLLDGSEHDIAEVLAEEGIQYADDKAGYIVENRSFLSQPTLEDPEAGLKLSEKLDKDPEKARKWIVGNIKGLSWKGASHFLRNIGRGEDFAIISSHIVGKMHQLGLVEEPELAKNEEEYLEYERKLQDFSEEVKIPLEELDLVLWSMKTGEVFK